jgi:PAS domain S-box-containing protein
MPDQSDKKSSRILRDVEEHFSQLVAGVQDYAIFLLDPSGCVLTWNAGAERIKGYAPEEIIGQSFTKFYPPESIADEFPQEELRQAALVGRFEDQGWRVRKDGTQFWANVVITALYDEHHEVRGYLKITRDLTERKLAEENLRQSEERFRLLVEGVEEYGIFMLDPEGKISSWNAGAQRIKGYSADEIIGKHFSIFYSSEDLAAGKPARALETAIRAGRCEDEGWRVRKDRSLFWANVVITALYDKERRLRGFAKLTRDMTQRRKVDELLVADRHKNEFLAMLAHELRNPLAPISNGLHLLRLSPSDDPVFQQTTQIMQRQVGHLVRIITGKISLHKEPIELSAVIARTLEEVQPLIDARGHELLVTQPARPLVVDADAVRLAQVLSNLLANAAKYTAEPSQIFLSVERHGDEATIRVRDSGIGIAADVLPSVFDLFVQADHSLERSRGGLGIGLTLVKRIVELHGGSVGATSAGAGQGSEFTVRLPLTREGVPAKNRASQQAEPKKAPRRRILVVDDNVDAAATVAKLLTMWGHEVHVVFSGPEALEAVRTFRPEILLLDIGLPGMSGYEVARQLRSDPSSKEIVITALTGYGQSEDRQRSYEAGFDFHITKPPGPEVLEALVMAPETFVGRLTSPKNN